LFVHGNGCLPLSTCYGQLNACRLRGCICWHHSFDLLVIYTVVPMAGADCPGGRERLQAQKASESFTRRRTDVTDSSINTFEKRNVRPSSAPLLGFGNGRPVPPNRPPGSQSDLSKLSATSSFGSRGHHRCCTDITMLDGVSPYYSYVNFDSSVETANRARQRNHFMHRSLHGSFHGEAEDSTLIAQHLDSTSVGMLLGGSCCAGVLLRHRQERSLLGDLQLDLSQTVKFRGSGENVAETALTPSTVSAVRSCGSAEAANAAQANSVENHSLLESISGDGGNDTRIASQPVREHNATIPTASQRPRTAGRSRRPASTASVRSNGNNGTPKAVAATTTAVVAQRPSSAARNIVMGPSQHMQVRSVAGKSCIASTTASVSLHPDVGIKGLLRRGGGRHEGSRPTDCERRKPDKHRLSGGATRSRLQARRERPRGMTHCSSAPCLSLL